MPFMYRKKRISIFCGHYGSGKTNIAVNYALSLKRDGCPVRIADLDIVNPYFRTKDSAAELEAAGIPLISPTFANTNVDLPALPQELYALVQQTHTYAVMDVGGDDRGAYALGRYAPYILEENDYDMFCVVNFYRPLTTTPEEAAAVMQEISAAAHLPFTAIINNSNLGAATTQEDVLATFEKCRELSRITGLEIAATCFRSDLLMDDADPSYMPLQLQKRYFDINE
ncbi:MAG: hypothetical protein J6S41_08280 [Clostridia bacterium]|nr:hypothetical protein [Clostridia bacterium]MBO5671530.1 hypothetical protein [Clostridia bacterium]